MDVVNELALIEKKKLVLGKIDEVLQTFMAIKTALLAILETTKHLDASIEIRERQKILQTTSPKEKELMELLDTIKNANAHRSNKEIHQAHSKISKNIHIAISQIIGETKLQAILCISEKLPQLVTQLSKSITTGIGFEYLVLSYEKKYTKISHPLDLESIRSQVVAQIQSIDMKMNDTLGIRLLIEYLDVGDNLDLLTQLLDYILGGKSYDEIKLALEEHGIFIEEVRMNTLHAHGELPEITIQKGVAHPKVFSQSPIPATSETLKEEKLARSEELPFIKKIFNKLGF